MVERLAGQRVGIEAHVDDLKRDRADALIQLVGMRGGEFHTMQGSVDTTAATIGLYERIVRDLDEVIANYEADLAAGRYVD